MYYFWFLTVFLVHCYCGRLDERWKYLNIQCRNNENKPEKWWYIYKPPEESFPTDFGRNFSYLTPDTTGRWVPSNVFITGVTMLHYTLMPLFIMKKLNGFATLVYDNNEPVTSARGILIADQMSGVWITHTVPGLPDFTKGRPTFPKKELPNGHLLTCMTLDLSSLNAVALSIRQTFPKYTHVRIPKSMKPYLSDWNFRSDSRLRSIKPLNLEFLLTDDSRASLLVRKHADVKSLYNKFALEKKIVLDVYGQSESDILTTVCRKNYGLRNINSISLKFHDEVHYIANQAERTWFAVSTAAHWQQTGSVTPQYWTCTSNLDKEDDTGTAGLLLCVENYEIWNAFSNLKVKEPECPS